MEVSKLIGFYRVLSATEGDYRSAVRPYTNAAFAGAVDWGSSEVGADQRIINGKTSLKKLANKDFRIVYALDYPGITRGQMLKVARPVWSSIEMLSIADENPSIDFAAVVAKVRQKIDALGLQQKPIGSVFTPVQLLEADARLWAPLDWVGIEAYHDLGNPNPPQQIRKRTNKIVEKLGAGKQYMIVGQAYSRNGAYKDQDGIEACNDMAWNFTDLPDCLGMVSFAYGRVGGTRDLPFLQERYKTYWSQLNA